MFSARGCDARRSDHLFRLACVPSVGLIALLAFQTGCVGHIGDQQEGEHGTFPGNAFAGHGYPGAAGSGFAGSGSPPFITAGKGGTVNNNPPRAGSGSPSLGGRGAPGQAGTSAPPVAGTSGSIQNPPTTTDDGKWSPLSTLMIVNPMDYGAKGDGTSDDLPAMKAAVNALPAAGGVVFFPSGKSFKKNDLLTITKNHVKLWSINRGAEIFAAVNGVRRKQAILCRNQGCGVFGLKLRSDATTRFDALEDNQISNDQGSLMEVAGVEIQGSAAVGIFLSGSKEHYIEGNYVHHTWADHIHHTSGAQTSWVWGNYIFNEAPSKGDDGVACVTYGTGSTRCADMEWWGNTILHTDWGRGYSVIGGNNISIHDNWAIGVAGAGVIVASETAYDSSASQGITISNNYVEGCGHAIAHPGILVSGQSSDAGPLRDISLTKNVSIPTPSGAYRAEGMYVNVTNTNLVTTMSALPTPVPTMSSVHMADTTVLRTRDISHVAANFQPGLYRIHIRRAASGTGYEQRFEYIVKGDETTVAAFTQARTTAGDRVSEQETVDGMAYALVLCASPVTLPAGLSGVAFRDIRTGDQNSKLSWLWQRINIGNY